MPGHNRETQANGALMIGYLDTGALERGVEGLPSIQWAKLVVRNLDFVNACPTAGFAMQANPYQLLIFGGATTKTFLLDTR